MAVTALHAAASGMRALDEKLNVVANNLANVNTVGFKALHKAIHGLVVILPSRIIIGVIPVALDVVNRIINTPNPDRVPDEGELKQQVAGL